MNQYYWAKIAYDAYKQFSRGKSLISGDALSDFENLSDNIKDAWKAASEAVVDQFVDETL